MDNKEKSNLIIYRVREKGLEVFLVKKNQTEEGWEFPAGEFPAGELPDGTLVATVEEDRIIALEPVEEVDGGLLEQSYAVEADWHDIPSLKSILKKDVRYMKNTIKKMVPDMMDGGTFFAVKEAFRRVLPHQYEMLKELKDIVTDRNSTKYM